MSQIEIILNIDKERLKNIIEESHSLSQVLKKLNVNNRQARNYIPLREKIKEYDISIEHFGPYERIYKNQEKLIESVKNNITLAGVLRDMGFKPAGGNYASIKKWIKKLNLDTSHWLGKYYFIKNKKISKNKKTPLNNILVENSDYNRVYLKHRLIEENLLENKCSRCGLEPIWNGEKLTLQLDHINGVNNDNRLENLRLLCPNCHTQTNTWGGKRFKKENKCISCGKIISNKSRYCTECIWDSPDIKKYHESLMKVKERPTLDQIEKDLKTMTMVAIGKKYGVTDSAVRKWIIQYKKETNEKENNKF